MKFLTSTFTFLILLTIFFVSNSIEANHLHEDANQRCNTVLCPEHDFCMVYTGKTKFNSVGTQLWLYRCNAYVAANETYWSKKRPPGF